MSNELAELYNGGLYKSKKSILESIERERKLLESKNIKVSIKETKK